MHQEFYHVLCLIFVGAGLLATIALTFRQSLLLAYIALGALIGPWGLAWIPEPAMVQQIGDFGILFLLFLLGLNLDPRSLWHLLKQTAWVTLLSSGLFAFFGASIAYFSGFVPFECLIVGIAMMFSSTILGVKLLPTTVLHHQKTGEIIISVLLLQDMIAIFVLLLLKSMATGHLPENNLVWYEIFRSLLALPVFVFLAFLAERFLLTPLLRRFNRIHEFIFLIAIAWCLACGALAEFLYLSFEMGAFIAGVVLAVGNISRFIAESLKPLRDFFLILFFFALGARMDLFALKNIWLQASVLAMGALLCKPPIFKYLLRHTQPSEASSWEVGVRMGQISEFSLLVAYYAFNLELIGERASYLIQSATLMTFVASSYWIVKRYPTPIAAVDRLRRD